MKTRTPESIATREVSEVAKKPYRKPSVQVYGTLAQVTGAQPNPGAFRFDPSAPPSTGQRT